MAGIYIHIPFCKKACHYCNFHFSTSLRHRSEMTEAILQEIDMRKDFLEGESVESIYFGGGTPSVLEPLELDKILGEINRHFRIKSKAEITLEANPDDLDTEKLNYFRNSGINRLSIGVQSFHEEDLQYLNRSHNAEQALKCINEAKAAGFERMNIDLIYGLPGRSFESWMDNVKRFLDLELDHLSAYALTIEPGTVYANWLKKGKFKETIDTDMERQYISMSELLESQGYKHYEISNLGKTDSIAVHNTNYWKGRSYLGVGPSAHSYNGRFRSWNVANNAKYLSGIKAKEVQYETELLDSKMRYNELVMLGLRTIWGIDIHKIRSLGEGFLSYFLEESEKFLKKGIIESVEDRFVLKKEHWFRADGIASELFI